MLVVLRMLRCCHLWAGHLTNILSLEVIRCPAGGSACLGSPADTRTRVYGTRARRCRRYHTGGWRAGRTGSRGSRAPGWRRARGAGGWPGPRRWWSASGWRRPDQPGSRPPRTRCTHSWKYNIELQIVAS